MKIRIAALGLIGTMLAGAAQGVYLIDDGEALNIVGNTSFGTNDVYMGVNTSENGLRVYNGYSVWANSLIVGHSSSSSSNWVELRANSTLSLSGALYVGFDSSGNTLTTSDGTAIYTYGVGVLGDYENSENNKVEIKGAEASWIMGADLYVGYGGNDNILQVADSATLVSEGSIYVGMESSADNNTITASNATVIANYDMVVGYRGARNQLQIVDGSDVLSYNGFVGVTNLANNNLIFVSGGSAWTNMGGLYVGNVDNSGNMVTVTNGGSIVVYDGLWIEGTGNEFNLDRGGSLTVHTNFDASMDGFNFNEGSALYVGGVLSNAAGSIEGERTIGLVGTNGWWNQAGSNVVVGGASSGNALKVEAGGWVDAGNLVVGSGTVVTGNTVSVTGTNSLLSVTDSISIGTASNADNVVEVSSGGTILLGNALVINGTNNTFNLGDGGWLVASNGLDVSASGFNFLAGGTLQSMGVLSGMDNSIEDGRAVLLTGSNAVWNLGTNALQIGVSSSSNALYVTDGASLASEGAMIGSVGTTGSLVYVTGAGSAWTNAGNLALDGYYNDLVITDEGRVAVARSLSVKNRSAISFASGGHASASNYYQDATSVFAFESVTNSPSSAALLVVDNAAEFEGGATVEYTGTISGLERGVVFTNRLVAADTLIVDGVTNASGADLDALNIAGLGTLLTIDLIAEDDDLVALISRMRLADSAGFAAGSDMAGVSEEIDLMADGGDARSENMLNTLSQLDSAGQNKVLSQLYDRHAPSYAHTKGMLDGFKQARTRGVVPDPMLPFGAFGPHFYGSQAQGWIKGYGSWGQRDSSGAFSGYDQSTYGAIVGIDKSYGDLLAGLAGGMATTDISQDDSDSSEARTGYGLFYASWGTLSWFGDFNLGYGRSSIEERSGTSYDTTADYDADQLCFYMGGGKEMVFLEDRLFITPSAALSGAYYVQESYTEKSTTAVPRKVDDFDYLSLQSELGLKASYMHDLTQSFLVPEIHANWLHEFNADEERIDYSLVGGTGTYSFGMDAPVEDLYEVGVGLSWWTRGQDRTTYEWSVGLDGRFGDGYTETTVSLRLLSQF